MGGLIHVSTRCIALWILLKLGLCWAFDVHISTETDQVGKVFYHSHLPDEVSPHHDNTDTSSNKWVYQLNPVRSSYTGMQLLAVDSFRGDLVLLQRPQCALLKHNPFLVVVDVRTRRPVDYDIQAATGVRDTPEPFTVVEIPLNVYIHGPSCKVTTRRALKHHHKVARTRNKIKISVNLGSNQGVCIDQGSKLLSLSKVLPLQSANCHNTYSLSTEAGHHHKSHSYALNPISGELTTTQLTCFYPDHHTITGHMTNKCEKETWVVPFKISIIAQEDPNSNVLVERVNSLHRVKRQVPSTSRNRRAANPPMFPQRLYIKTVPEEHTPCCLVVGTFSILDPDSHRVIYELVPTRDSRSASMFSINPNSGQVSTTIPLDRENIPVHNFSIIATNLDNRAERAQAALTIYVEDANDHAPEFESDTYPQAISESISIGATVLTVHASDGDTGTNAEIEYSILNPSGPNGVFRINPRTGSIYTHGLLDREMTSSYTLRVAASDKAPVPFRKSATAEVVITVLDENDNRPQFMQTAYDVRVQENKNYNEDPVIATITAIDRDEGVNGMVRYSITGGNNQNIFAIDAITGKLTLLAPLDYERTSNYRLVIRAQDSGQPRKSNSTNVIIHVEDVNDNPPIFTTPHLQESILEDEPVGHTVTRVQAFDNDDGPNAALIYSIIEAPEEFPFSINKDTGVLKTSSLLDREKTALYFFKILAVDQGIPPKTATASVQITIRDVNDNAPIFKPKLYSEIVSEEAQPGTPVVSVTAVDYDENENSQVSYAISEGNDGHAFNIIRQMGQGLITVARTLNYKEQSRYVISVTASDPGGLVDTALVYINISDANTYRPVFRGTPYQTRVDEDTPVGSTIYKVLAFDNDVGENARITYVMADNEAFQINPVSGEIIVKHPLDREKLGAYTVSVTANDHGRPSKSDTADVEITVNDVNDNSPEFLESSYRGNVKEDAIVGTSILTISARDADASLNGAIRYTFHGGTNGGGDFKLDPTLGILRIAKPLDRERVANYELRAFAVDRGIPERSTSVIINIHVEDVNDNMPWFEANRLMFDVNENSPIGTTVSTISANDPDEGVNAEVKYSIIGGPDADSFSLSTGPHEPATIKTLVELDYESGKTQYSILVQARSFHLFSETNVIINVIDVNDNVPELKDFVVIFNNFRNHFPTGEIGMVPASDPDVNDKLKYKFVSGNSANILHLNEETGMIRLDSRLNSDVPTNGTLQVSVTDGINTVKATCRLFVRLVTESMLYNSITIRLNALTQTAFLSPLYHHFVTALASIIPTTDDNIFIINVNDDVDVPERILNVSFSVRRRVENNRDVFYSPQFLRERVYHQRNLLAKLSTLEVLPFDDNLCVREPCLNFEQCVSILKFGNASSFVGSSTMLFRPIHPINAFACVCPRGFTGMEAEYLCDTEVNLCYSSPCGGNGTCQRHEGGYTCHCAEGYTGEQCEIDMRYKKYTPSTCPPDVCKGQSHCASLIRGGFRCERCPDDDLRQGTTSPPTSSNDVSSERFCIDCADMDYRTRYCELTTRSFLNGSFLMFPALKRRHRFEITLEFSTRQKSGILFYNGRYNERHDFVALEIVDGALQFSFSLGYNVTRVVAGLHGGVNDGRWHRVKVTYFNRTATLTIGDKCDTAVATLVRARTGNVTCAAKSTHVLEERCADITETCYRFLDLTGPFQVGGLPSLPTEFQIQNTDFVGCIRNITIDDEFLDLNDFVWNSGTVEGCPQKRDFCEANTCKNGGTCLQLWHTYQCRCPVGWGGKDCSQAIEQPRRLKGTSYLQYTGGIPPVSIPWYNGLSFRTRHHTSVLLSVSLGGRGHVKIQLIQGMLHYIYNNHTVVLHTVRVDDGNWHYVEVRWYSGKLVLTLDYGQIQMTEAIQDWVAGREVHQVVVGGLLSENSPSGVINGFQGCVENVRVGNSDNSILTGPLEHDVEPGCRLVEPCDSNPCPPNSYCYNQWGSFECRCERGYVGSKCQNVCTAWNPCQNGGTCVWDMTSSTGYHCSCREGFTGKTCEASTSSLCPATWWGSPICGPCNCSTERGFNSSCNKTTGQCSCKDNHYRPPNSDTCYPCDCYHVGSYRRACDPDTGQCPCRLGVIGRRCDSCSSHFAEVTLRGCEVVYDACPHNYDSGLWWDRTLFGEITIQSCPEGTVGDAVRECTKEGWLAPRLFNCTSDKFVDLYKQMVKFKSGELKVNTFVAKHLMTKLSLATNETKQLYGMDLKVAASVLTHILQHENRQAGLNLTHTQDRNFVQNVIDTVGRLLAPEHGALWRKVHEADETLSVLFHNLEEYGATLAKNMLQLFTQPFDVVHENIVFSLDYIVKDNRTQVVVPKYNNKVQDKSMFDKDTNAIIPMRNFAQPSMADMVVEMIEKKKPRAVVNFVIYRTLGQLLPLALSSDVTGEPGMPVQVNSPVFTLNVVDGNRSVGGHLKEPVVLDMSLLESSNRTRPQCVYWKVASNGHGEWSTEGCRTQRYQTPGRKWSVKCECSHLTSFAVIMEVSSVEYLRSTLFRLHPVTYIGVCVAILLVLAVLLLLCILRGLYSNMNSIRINLMLAILLANLIFIIGIDKVNAKMGCKVVAILLHYFYLVTFSWMFVETLHIYRMMTEIRNINQGSMKFYYVIGYVVPGIITGLTVGLNTDAYGNRMFCWLRTSEAIIWSLAGPICLAVMANIIVFVMALYAGCRAKQADPDFSTLRHGLRAAIVLLPLLGLVWAFAVIAVNDRVPAFQHLFTAFSLLQGVFVFLAYVVFNKKVRKEIKYAIWRLQGKKTLDDTMGDGHTSVLSRSALAYHNDSSLDGGLNRMNVGISTTSTTSRSTSKSSGALYRDAYLGNSLSTSNSTQPPTGPMAYPPNAGIAPYGYDSSMFHDKPVDGMYPDTGELTQPKRPHRRRRRDSDSDSELSAMGQDEMDLASSHSSDDDDDDNNYTNWDKPPKHKALARVRGTHASSPTPPSLSPTIPVHSTPSSAPPAYSTLVKPQWPGEGNMSTTTASDSEIKSPEQIKVSVRRPMHTERQLPPIPGSPRAHGPKGSNDMMMPPERIDSLPSDKPSPRERIAVQVLTHNGSITSESETDSDSSSDCNERWA